MRKKQPHSLKQGLMLMKGDEWAVNKMLFWTKTSATHHNDGLSSRKSDSIRN